MYINARLVPNGERTPMKRTLFPKVTEESLCDHEKLMCMLSKRLPVTCTELDLEPNGPIELFLAVVAFCHLHEITLRVDLYNNLNHAIYVLMFNNCTTCGARFSSAFHNRCPHCGGWGYSPYYEAVEKEYKTEILEEK